MRKTIFLSIIVMLFIMTINNVNATNSDGFKIRVSIRDIEPFTYTSVRQQGPLSDMENGSIKYQRKTKGKMSIGSLVSRLQPRCYLSPL